MKQNLDTLCEKRNLKQTPWLLFNDTIDGPQATGFLRPAILVPSIFGNLDQNQRRMILLHELAHIQRNDIKWRVLLEVLSILFWFHPLVWLAIKNYDLQVEKSCDDAVLHAEYPAAKYSEVILASIHSCSRQKSSKPRAPKQLSARILSIVNKGKSRHPMSRSSALKFSLLFLLVTIPIGMVSFTPHHRDPGYELIDSGDDLKALWRMKIGLGSIIADSSGNSCHGKIYGAQWVKDPKKGVCLSFDGKSDHLILRAPDASWTGKPFSLCVWLKPAQHSDGGGLILRGDPNKIWCSTINSGSRNFGEREILLSGKLKPGQPYTLSTGLFPVINFWGVCASQSYQPLPSNEWSHFTLVWSPTGSNPLIQIYLNGKQVGVEHLQRIERGNQYDWLAPVWYFGIGESPISINNNYEGFVSDLAIYQKSLSPKEVKRVMQGDF